VTRSSSCLLLYAREDLCVPAPSLTCRRGLSLHTALFYLPANFLLLLPPPVLLLPLFSVLHFSHTPPSHLFFFFFFLPSSHGITLPHSPTWLTPLFYTYLHFLTTSFTIRAAKARTRQRRRNALMNATNRTFHACRWNDSWVNGGFKQDVMAAALAAA